jgi:hypothetical protein
MKRPILAALGFAIGMSFCHASWAEQGDKTSCIEPRTDTVRDCAGVLMPSTLRLPDDFYPESVVISKAGDLYAGSLRDGSIVRMRAGEIVWRSDPQATQTVSILGLHLDEKQASLYACSGDNGSNPSAPKQVSALKRFDLASGRLLASYPLPGDGLCNDIAAAPNGDLLVTDTRNPRILRLAKNAEALEVWLEDRVFGSDGPRLNGIVFDGPNDLYVSIFKPGAIFHIAIDGKGAPTRVRPVALSVPIANGDGLRRLAPGKLLLADMVAGGEGKLVLLDIGPDRDTAKVRLVAGGLGSPSSVVITPQAIFPIESQIVRLLAAKGSPEPGRVFVLRQIAR